MVNIGWHRTGRHQRLLLIDIASHRRIGDQTIIGELMASHRHRIGFDIMEPMMLMWTMEPSDHPRLCLLSDLIGHRISSASDLIRYRISSEMFGTGPESHRLSCARRLCKAGPESHRMLLGMASHRNRIGYSGVHIDIASASSNLVPCLSG